MTRPIQLRLAGVSRRFGHGPGAVQAVRGASLTVSAGEVVAVMGPSGSGKSTLLCLMAGLLTPDEGEVRVGEWSLASMPEPARSALRRTQLGFVFQRFNLLKAFTAVENVALPLVLAGASAAAARSRAEKTLEHVGMAARAGALPCDLSGGEQQRVAVARALAPRPTLVLADEPTGNLDSANGRTVIELICTHVRQNGAAAVIVTHDHRVRAAVDRVLRMEDGVLREDGDANPRDRNAGAR